MHMYVCMPHMNCTFQIQWMTNCNGQRAKGKANERYNNPKKPGYNKAVNKILRSHTIKWIIENVYVHMYIPSMYIYMYVHMTIDSILIKWPLLKYMHVHCKKNYTNINVFWIESISEIQLKFKYNFTYLKVQFISNTKIKKKKHFRMSCLHSMISWMIFLNLWQR